MGGRTEPGASEVEAELGGGCKRDRPLCRVTQVPLDTAPGPACGSLAVSQWPRAVTAGTSEGTCWPPLGTHSKSWP